MRVVAGDCRNVVAKVAKVDNQAKIGALIKQKLHKGMSEAAPLGGFGETSSPVTIALA